jgi:hypothetical protein
MVAAVGASPKASHTQTGARGTSRPPTSATREADRARARRARHTFTFAEAPEAHRLSEGGHVRGKLVLVPG